MKDWADCKGLPQRLGLHLTWFICCKPSPPGHLAPPTDGAGLLQFLVRVLMHPLLHLLNGPHLLHRPFTMSNIHKLNVTRTLLNLLCVMYYNMYVNRIKLPGQSCSSHGSCIVFPPSHLPPFASSTIFVLVLVLLPFPHVFEQSPICHSPHSQSILEAKKRKYDELTFIRF